MDSITAYTAYWYQAEGKDLADKITSNVRWLQSNACRARLDMAQMSARLYGGAQAAYWGGWLGGSAYLDSRPVFPDKVTYNVISSTSDTVHARVGKHRPLPLFFPTGADYRVQRRAKKLSQFIEGIFLANDVWELAGRMLLDGIFSGMGVIKVSANVKNQKMRYERVLHRDLLWDPAECQTSALPRSLYQVMLADRKKLKDVFKKGAIEALATATTTDLSRPVDAAAISDQVRVVEAWHLPSSPEAGDGRRTISVDGAVLLSEPYEHDTYPFVYLYFKPRINGFDGQGVGELLMGLQNEINTYLYIISKATRKAGTRKIAVEMASKIDKRELTNEADAIIQFSKTPPQYLTPPIVAPEIYAHLENLKQSAYPLIGVSQAAVAAEKPPGVVSGKAVRIVDEREADRLSQLSMAYEQVFIGLARLTVRCMRESFSKGFSVNLPGRAWLNTLDWAKVSLEDSQYTLKLWPTNLEGRSPAAQMQDVQDLSSVGFISQREARRMLTPSTDIDAVGDLQNAAEDYCDYLLSMIIDGDPDNNDLPTLLDVEPWDDLVTLRRRALETYNWGRVNKMEAEKLELLRQLMRNIDALSQEQAAQAMAQQVQVQNRGVAESSPAPNPNLTTPQTILGAGTGA